MRTLPLLLLPLSLPLIAADLQIRDLRLEVGRGTVTNYDASFRFSQGGGSVTPSGTYTTDDYEGSDPVLVSAIFSKASLAPVGFLWAAGIEYQHTSDEFDGERFDTDMFGGKVRLGMGWTPAPLWRLEATAEGHLGYMQADDGDLMSSGEFDRATATGSYSAFGLQVGGGYAIKGKWEVGVSLRVLRYDAETEADFDTTGGSYAADFSWVFWSAALTGGYRF